MAEDNRRDLPDGVPASKQQLSNIDPDLISEFATQPGDPDPIPIKTFEERAAEEFARLEQLAAENPDANEIASQSTSSDIDGTVARLDTIDGAEQTPTFSPTSRTPISYPDPDPAPAPTQSDTSPEPPTEDPEVITQTTSRRARAQAARVRDREPENPTEDSEVNEQQSKRDTAQSQRIENADAEVLEPLTSPAAARVDSTVSRRAQAQINRFDREVASDPTSYESLTDEQLRAQTASTKSALDSLDALPTQERLRVQTQIDALENQLDLLDQETARRRVRGSLEDQVASGKRAPTPVDDTQAKEQQLVFDDADDPTLPRENPEEPAQINQAALDRLRQQSAAQQQREPQGTGDWRVKLRLASGADYFYKATLNNDFETEGGPGILFPLAATDGIVFPYTPSIQILYAAEYNQYHPTHSNYQHYFYKGSKVGEVVMTATFTAQDTEEANYLLAVIHFLKSASKMFYGQDPERGSPPPLLFLTGLGDYQFNEAPCVISQFNYVLPNDVDYIRANVSQIRAGETNQTNLRNRNTGAALNSYSSRINRILTTPGLTIGAENPTSRISSKTANLSSDTATYVPTKMEMTITLLPVQNRLQVSEGFSLKQYANGSLIKGGFW